MSIQEKILHLKEVLTVLCKLIECILQVLMEVNNVGK